MSSTDFKQQSISSSIQGPCGLAPETKDGRSSQSSIESAVGPFAVMAKVNLLWDNGSTITYSYFGGTKNQQAAVDLVAPEWTWFANLTLQRKADNDRAALIRITFDRSVGSWSSIGKGALRIKDGKPTMNLGWLLEDDTAVLSANDRGTILHEWGHALGLMHEHQSSARGGIVTLEPSKVYEYHSATQGWPHYLIKSQILDVFNVEDISNFSSLDLQSVMKYFMPGSMNEQGIDVNPNDELTDMDKAYMVINYTRTVPHDNAQDWTLQKALDIICVPSVEQKTFLTCNDTGAIRCFFAVWANNARGGQQREAPRSAIAAEPCATPPSFETRLIEPSEVILPPQKACELSYCEPEPSCEPSSELSPYQPEPFCEPAPCEPEPSYGSSPCQSPCESSPCQPSSEPLPSEPLVQSELQALSQLTSVPLLSKPSPETLPIPPSEPSTRLVISSVDSGAQPQLDLSQAIVSALDQPTVHQAIIDVIDVVVAPRGLNTQMIAIQYVEVHESIWSGIMGAIKKPTFLNVLGMGVNSALTERGLNAPMTRTADFDVQSVILSGILDTVKNPFFQQVVSTIVNTAFGLQELQNSGDNIPDIDAQDSIHQRALLSAVTDAVTAALASRGVNPQVALEEFDIQQGIFSGVAGVLKDQNFQLVVGHVVDAALKEHGVQKLRRMRSFQNLKSTPLPPIQNGLNPQLMLTTPRADISSQPDVQRALLSLAGNLSVDTLMHGLAPIANSYTNGSFSGLLGNGLIPNGIPNALSQSSISRSASPVNGISTFANDFGANGLVNGTTRSRSGSFYDSNNLGNQAVNGLPNSSTANLSGYPTSVRRAS